MLNLSTNHKLNEILNNMYIANHFNFCGFFLLLLGCFLQNFDAQCVEEKYNSGFHSSELF